jgi:mono/diheme cytochrome c family protein
MNSKKKLEDEINFKELIKNPIRLFGWVFPLFMILILVLGIFFVKHLTDISFNVQNVGIQDSTLVKKEIELKKGGATSPVDFKLVKAPTEPFIAKGKELFDANCKSCHGENGMGDGPAGIALAKKPRNFHSMEGWTNGRSIDQMFKTLQEGITKNGMAAYEYIPAPDRFAIISFIRTFAQFPPVTDEQLKSLDAAYKLSVETVLPNTMPVKLAENKLIEENSITGNLEKKFIIKVNVETSEGAVFLKDNVINYKKVFNSFIISNAKQKPDKFIADVLANPINAGFKPTVAQLNREEWMKLYNYLKSSIM